MTAGAVAEDTRSRLLTTALRLFSEHGVEGTSLQMIADELGVTKAAVYYHFKTKDEITEAVAAPALRRLHQIMDEAAAQRTRGARTDHALDGFIDLIVEHRTLLALVSSDPGLLQRLDGVLGLESFKDRMMELFVGPAPGVADRVTVQVTLSGLALAGGSPDNDDLDDTTLRAHLTDVGRKLLGRRRRPPADKPS